MIKTTSYDQQEIINNIIKLHNDGAAFCLDPTYSKGKFYLSGGGAATKNEKRSIPRA